jgi:peptide/nickel transport system permease protein
MVPTLIGITLVTFVIVQLAPGDPVTLAMGMQGDSLSATRGTATQQIVLEQRKLLGLDKPLWMRYPIWLGKLAVLDFGRSFKDQRPVREIVAERLPVTIQIELLSVLLAYVISIPIGVHSAVRAGSASERVTTVILFILYSLPSFWVAYILLYFLAGGSYWHIFPVGGASGPEAANYSAGRWLVDRLWHLALPILVLTYGSFAGLSRFMRTGMMDVLRQDYIRTARAKGLSERTVIFKHAMRNSIIPIVTILSGLLPGLIGGAVITETIFNIKGMGQLGYNAVLARDYPVIMAVAVLSAVLTLVGILLSDILYAVVDPRIKYD